VSGQWLLRPARKGPLRVTWTKFILTPMLPSLGGTRTARVQARRRPGQSEAELGATASLSKADQSKGTVLYPLDTNSRVQVSSTVFGKRAKKLTNTNSGLVLGYWSTRSSCARLVAPPSTRPSRRCRLWATMPRQLFEFCRECGATILAAPRSRPADPSHIDLSRPTQHITTVSKIQGQYHRFWHSRRQTVV
jgi:hypothetical protein